MLALTFTCRALLVFLLSEPVQTERAALFQPFLIAENMWPRGCVLDCQRGRHRAVCGSNGRLYKSQCAFQRAQCINTQLRVAPRAHCSDLMQTKCQLARAQGLEARARSSHVSPAAAVFVPECSPEGHYLPTQCHNQTGYCWCSTADGIPVSGTTVIRLIPDCTDHIAKLAQNTDTDSDEAGEPGPTADPRKSGGLTAPPFWVTILMNSEPKGNHSVRRPARKNNPQTCEHERAQALLLSRILSPWQEKRFIPECTADSRYSPVQCHTATGYCWCVREDSGRPLPGTSARNRIPDCTGAREAPTDTRPRKPLQGCPGARKKKKLFLKNLVRALQLEAKHAGNLSPHLASTSSASNSSYTNTTSSATPSSSSPLDLDPSAVPEVEETSSSDVALRWHFSQLDMDSSGVLSEREARPLRQFLRRRLKPRRCIKKFAQYCDGDGDRGLTLEELRVCLDL
ncbi:SPARC-related modular calcium-binding protein 1-like [Parambassis ranga]|uniref:SPARC-related modular calcium-binding protein 1-like n=1 Tax=Parambassis ranga TaxID=210632 RepID=A0A6P7JK01_9TELE|nr:SPARC-related modular calcium-binding protein 1-like [Parambassis ranga]